MTQSYFFDTFSVKLIFVKDGVKNTDVFFHHLKFRHHANKKIQRPSLITVLSSGTILTMRAKVEIARQNYNVQTCQLLRFGRGTPGMQLILPPSQYITKISRQAVNSNNLTVKQHQLPLNFLALFLQCTVFKLMCLKCWKCIFISGH